MHAPDALCLSTFHTPFWKWRKRKAVAVISHTSHLSHHQFQINGSEERDPLPLTCRGAPLDKGTSRAGSGRVPRDYIESLPFPSLYIIWNPPLAYSQVLVFSACSLNKRKDNSADALQIWPKHVHALFLHIMNNKRLGNVCRKALIKLVFCAQKESLSRNVHPNVLDMFWYFEHFSQVF